MIRLLRRKAKRRRFRAAVRYGRGNLDNRGFTTDLSPLGLAIKTNKVFPPGTELLLALEVDDKFLLARGVVRWARQVPPLLINYVRCGMGIEFVATSKRFKRFLVKMERES
jgi:hypothetical protein